MSSDEVLEVALAAPEREDSDSGSEILEPARRRHRQVQTRGTPFVVAVVADPTRALENRVGARELLELLGAARPAEVAHMVILGLAALRWVMQPLSASHAPLVRLVQHMAARASRGQPECEVHYLVEDVLEFEGGHRVELDPLEHSSLQMIREYVRGREDGHMFLRRHGRFEGQCVENVCVTYAVMSGKLEEVSWCKTHLKQRLKYPFDCGPTAQDRKAFARYRIDWNIEALVEGRASLQHYTLQNIGSPS